MGKVLIVYSDDITDQRFNRRITCSDDPKEHLKYHIRNVLVYAANRITEEWLFFPLRLSLGEVRENANVKLALTIQEIDEND